MGEEKESTFKVSDKRLFDADGNERDFQADTASSVNNESKITEQTKSTDTKETSEKVSENGAQHVPEEINFSTFVMSLAMQAFIQLGEVEPPAGYNVPKDKMAAKQTIDILRMISQKTKGNLDSNEDWMLKDVLQRLQLSFVKAQ